jgi:type I restriction enzyme, S subunit
MQISIASLSEAFKYDRIDADFFKLDYKNSSIRASSKKNDFLFQIAHISDGNHLKVAEEFIKYPGVRYLRGQDLSTDMMLSDRNIVYISEILFQSLKRSHIHKDDILITIVGANTGLVGLVYSAPDKLIASCKLGIIRPQGSILSGYLYSFLASHYGQSQILRSIRGGGQTGLILPDLKQIQIVRCSEAFERSTHRITYNGHKLIEQSRNIYYQADKILLSKLGLVEWMPKHPLSFIKNFSDTQNSERIDAEYFQPIYEEVVKSIKASKNYSKLGDIVSIKKCIEPGSEAYQESGIPFLRVSNLSKFGINNDNQQYIPETLYESLKTYQPKKGEILLSKDATPGIAYYLKDALRNTIPSSGILRVTVKDPDRIYPAYLTLVLNSAVVQKQIERDAGGSIINHWLVDQVKDTLIPILPVSVQKKIAEKVDQSFSDRNQSKHLLDIAKRGVEIAIEKSESEAEKWMKVEERKIVKKIIEK